MKAGEIMKDLILSLENKAIKEGTISFEDATVLAKIDDDRKLQMLYEAADNIRDKLSGKCVDLCSIINAKSGSCPEDCKFCAQSIHHNTNIDKYSLIKKEKAKQISLENEKCGINRIALVTSGKGLKGREFEQVLEMYKHIAKSSKMGLCASLGILSYEQMLKLKEVGVSTYHHNLETNREYYAKICTTHSYDERIKTINNAQKAGLRVCSGGIIGVGETLVDRIKLAIELKGLNIMSIPINILDPIKGTPLENMERLTQKEILKTVAIFRFINPTSHIRLAGGRRLIDDYGRDCFKAGVNATITGNYLTTSGNKVNDDIKMIKDLDLEVRTNG